MTSSPVTHSEGDNRNLLDDNTAQSLSKEDIQKIKEESTTGRCGCLALGRIFNPLCFTRGFVSPFKNCNPPTFLLVLLLSTLYYQLTEFIWVFFVS